MSEVNKEILNKVQKVIADVLNIDETDITEDKQIIHDLGAESLDIVSMLMELEDEFGCKIPDEDVEQLVTVKNVIEYIKEKNLGTDLN